MQRSLPVTLGLGMLLLACASAQEPHFTFAASNYHVPADQASIVQSPSFQEGNGPQPNGTTLDTTLFHFAGPPVQAFPGQVFRGNTGCSPHSPSDYMTIANMLDPLTSGDAVELFMALPDCAQVVPTVESKNPAIRTWRQTEDGGPQSLPTSVIYMDLPSGLLVVASPKFNWTQQLSYMNYTNFTPSVVDLQGYRQTLSQLINVTKGLVTGQPPWTSPGAPCNRPIPALNGTLAYLQAAQAQLLNATNIDGGLRPTEVRLPSGCIQEEDANYKGTLVSPVLNNTMDGDQCCQMCRNQTGCNVWVWCPLTDGCKTGSGTFPYLGCQLKYQANVSDSYSPQPLPDAWSRGPPTAFVSGRLAYA